MSHAGFWTEFNKIFDAKYRSIIIVKGDESLDISSLKLCIDDHAHGTGARFADLAPQNSIYTRVESGIHSLVLMERDPRKPGRLVSNNLRIEIEMDEQITVRALLRDGQFLLEPENVQPHSA